MFRFVLFSMFILGTLVTDGIAQDPRTSCMVSLFRDNMAPGQVGQMQLARDSRLRDYLQAVEIKGARGLQVSLPESGVFCEPSTGSMRIALLVGAVYRLKLGGIPGHEGEELYPTVEVIDRLYPPAEREHRFPIPIVFDEDDLERALNGELVLRVVYLEDSQIAAPVSYADGLQRTYELTGREDALQTADRMGRPMAIIRIGSRVPLGTGDLSSEFLYGCPLWQRLKELPDREKLIEEHGWPRMEYPETVAPDASQNSTSSPPLLRQEGTEKFEGRARAKTARIGG